jgi:hypothetical protein
MEYFQNKNFNLGNFLGPCNGRCMYLGINYDPFGLIYGHLVYFMVIWCILWSFGIFFSFWYDVPRKIWQACKKVTFV